MGETSGLGEITTEPEAEMLRFPLGVARCRMLLDMPHV